MRWSPPLFSSLPATIRAILSKSTAPQPEVTVRGWIKSIRQHKNFSFAVISDGSTAESLQAVFKADVDTEQYVSNLVFVGSAEKGSVTLGASVLLEGRLEKSRGGGQEMELVVKRSTVLGICDTSVSPDYHLPPLRF